MFAHHLLCRSTAVLLVISGSVFAAELTTIVDSGKSTNRVDMVFIGDGYQANEIETTYKDHVDSAMNYFFNDSASPLPRYRNFFNIHRIDVISVDSGADDPVNNVERDTALGSSYRWDGQTDRLLYFNTGTANQMVGNALAASNADVDMRIGVINSSKYGGGGGSWAVYAGGNRSALPVAIHEVGHSFAGLADEYYTDGTVYTGGEPGAPNVTTDANGAKWQRWLGYDDPTSDIGPIGAFEGGQYREQGVFRPSANSMMRSLGRPLDAIGREAFIKGIYDEVDPLDDWLDTNHLVSLHDEVWVNVIDENIIDVEWLIDGTSTGLFGTELSILGLGLAPGEYTLTASAYDTLLDHSFSGNALDWWRLDEDPLRQSVSWNLSVTAFPEPNACTFAIITLVSWNLRRRAVRRSPQPTIVPQI